MVDNVNFNNYLINKIIYISINPELWEKLNPGYKIYWSNSQLLEYKFRDNISEKGKLNPYIGIIQIYPLNLKINELKKVKEYDNKNLREIISNMLIFQNKTIKNLEWFNENKTNDISENLQSKEIIQIKVTVNEDKDIEWIRVYQNYDLDFNVDDKTIKLENNKIFVPIDNETLQIKDNKLIAIQAEFPDIFIKFMQEHYQDFKRISLLLRPRFNYKFTYCGKYPDLDPDRLEILKNRALNILDLYICVNKACEGQLDKVTSNIIDWLLCENKPCENELPERIKDEIFELSKKCNLHCRKERSCC